MAKDKEHELRKFLPTEEDESNAECQQDATSGQKDGCETQGEHIDILPAEGEESDDSSSEPSVAVRGESRGRKWFSSCLRRLRCNAEKTGKEKGYDRQKERLKELLKRNQITEKDVMKTINDGKFEDFVMKMIDKGRFEGIEQLVTPRIFVTDHRSNTLLLSMKVSYKLHKLADAKGPDAVRFQRLANSVEKFTYCLLDEFKSNPEWCERFGDCCLDDMLDDAIEYDQKKFFTHPAVHSEMNRKWNGREFMKSEWKPWQLTFFTIWCLLDLIFSPILLAVFSLLRNNNIGNQTVAQVYLDYLESPYYKFVRDTLSYIILLFLHYALCLSPSTIAFSGLEWSILLFFIGRCLVELKQIWGIKKWLRRSNKTKKDGAPSYFLKIISRYVSDTWNKLDFVSLVAYSIILILRIVTWIISGSVTNNRALVIAGYLYSFNTFCLTLRAFGHVMEQSKEVGTIQIALFTILKDIRAIIWQFMAVIVAFSMAITKIYMSEKSFVANGSDRHETACKESGFSCWWAIALHLCWSLLDQSEESDPLESVDLTSVTLARILYAAFLIMGVILLVNMLIALLSNTYQKTEDNSIMEWSFKRAVTIQTYDGYDPIPVPLNIIYNIFITLLMLCKKDGSDLRDKEKGRNENPHLALDVVTEDLERAYFNKHAHNFPVTDDIETKVDDLQMKVKEIEGSRQMMSQIIRTTFQSQIGDQGKLCTGQTAWHCDQGIQIEGPLLTFEFTTYWKLQGARYRTQFSPEFPHFEVIIIETGKKRRLGIGVVNEGYDTTEMPGLKENSTGYHTDSGKVFPYFHDFRYFDDSTGRETVGPKARRGDHIRCTVMFEKKQEKDGKAKVPVFFTLNGKKITFGRGAHHHYLNCDNPLFPFICMTEGCSVLAKMCAKMEHEHQIPPLQEITANPADVVPSETGALKENSPELQEIKADLADVGKILHNDLAAVRGDMCSKEDALQQSLQLQENLEDIVSREVKRATRCLEEKLDALLAKLSEKEK